MGEWTSTFMNGFTIFPPLIEFRFSLTRFSGLSFPVQPNNLIR